MGEEKFSLAIARPFVGSRYPHPVPGCSLSVFLAALLLRSTFLQLCASSANDEFLIIIIIVVVVVVPVAPLAGPGTGK